MTDLEIMLARTFGWSVREIDDTDVESLLLFVMRFAETGGKAPKRARMAYIDQVDGW